MFNLISYRATFCRNGRLSPDGTGLIQIECSQQRRKLYFSSKIKVLPEQFRCGQVVNHPIADAINYRLRQMIYDLQTIEIDCMRRGIPPTLESLRQAWLESSRPTARVVDFGVEMLNSTTSRGKMTRRSYHSLFNSLEKFRPSTLLQDIDYTYVTKYDAWLKAHGSGHNTRVCRLRILRTIMLEAKRRNIIQVQPFERFKIPAMASRKGFLTRQQLTKVENLRLAGKLAIVRDCFLLSVYTGLRFSDVSTLRNEHYEKGWICKKMVKTNIEVKVPTREIFEGKAADLIERYGSINALTTKIGSNATCNKYLKEVLSAAGCGDLGYSFHTARHTFASLLLQDGVNMTTIQRLLGHSSVSTTMIYAEVTEEVIKQDLKKTARKKRQTG